MPPTYPHIQSIRLVEQLALLAVEHSVPVYPLLKIFYPQFCQLVPQNEGTFSVMLHIGIKQGKLESLSAISKCLDLKVTDSDLACTGGRIHLMTAQHFIAQGLPLSTFHCLSILFACWEILHAFWSSVDFFFKLAFFQKKIFQEYHQSVKQFGYRSGPTFCRA